MRYKTMGRTGVQVSAVGLGGNMFGNPVDQAGTRAVIDKALELGINFVDTAEAYGHGASEELLGKALAGRRDQVVLATKTGARGPKEPALEAGGRLTRRRIIERLEGSLRRLATEYVDVYYFHAADPITPIEESMRAVDDLVTAGKIRYFGISNFAGWQVAEAVGVADRCGMVRPAVEQSHYNLLDRAIEQEVLPACEHFGVSLVPYSPLARGFLTGKYERGAQPPADSRFGRTTLGAELLTPRNFAALERYGTFAAARGRPVGELAIAWLATNPVVCSVIAGATSPAQVEANAKAADWVLSADEVKELAPSAA